MSSDGGWKRSGQQRARIDLAIEQLEAQIDAREQSREERSSSPGGRACQRRSGLCAVVGVVRQAFLPSAKPGYDALNIEAKS